MFILVGSFLLQADLPSAMPFIFFPVVVHAMDIVVSSVGILFVTAAAHSATNPMDQLTRGYRYGVRALPRLFIRVHSVRKINIC